jgi:SAM-dependent methyltransferase
MKRHCQICGGRTATALKSNAMTPLDGLDMSYVLARCGHCGFHFAQDLPDEAQYLRYYSGLSKYDSQPKVSELDRLRIDAAVRLCDSLSIPKESHIIDLGCGFGALLSGLREAGWKRLSGVDPAPQSARQAKEQFGLDCIRLGTLAQAAEMPDLAQADLICLMAVLEHLPELRRDLSTLITRMRPGALILVEVPALELFDAERAEPYGELSLEHIQFFSAQSMRNLFKSLGAGVVEQSLVAIPSLHSGELFVLAQVGSASPETIAPEDAGPMDSYLAGSAERFEQVRRRVPDQPFVLYGAGSHSARLVAQMSPAQQALLVAVVDGNSNLHGKRFGDWTVQAPQALSSYLGLEILISSYRSERAIATDLKQRYPDRVLRLIYGNA